MCSVATLAIFLLVLCWLKTETAGLPIPRQELGLSKSSERDDIIAGMDFLSVLMRSSNEEPSSPRTVQKQRNYRETTPSAYDITMYDSDRGAFTPVIRGSRSSSSLFNSNEAEEEETVVPEDIDSQFGKKTSGAIETSALENSFRSNTDNQNSDVNNKITSEQQQMNSDPNLLDQHSDKPRVIEIRVSSSVGQSLINKKVEYVPSTASSASIKSFARVSTTETPIFETETTTAQEQTTLEPTEAIEEPTTAQRPSPESEEAHQHLDETLLVSEDHPSLIAEVNKSEFSIEESEPITRNTYLSNSNANDHANTNPQEYPASVRAIPSLQNYQIPGANPDYLAQQLARQKGQKLQPYHQTVVYHNSPVNSRDSNRARSVSYSTVIQAVPHQNVPKHWSDSQKIENIPKPMPEVPLAVPQEMAPPQGAVAESKDFYVTSKYQPNPTDYNESLEKRQKQPQNWEKPEQVESTSKRHQEPTERNWGVPEKRYGLQSKPYRTENQPQAAQAQRLHHQQYHRPEQNYEVDESVSVMTNGRTHGVQPSPTVSTVVPNLGKTSDQGGSQGTDQQNAGGDGQDQKVGYVVEGRNFRKYRVEERTSDGFIVGEYGVVSHDDGSLRGVRYTADGTISPRLIYDALMKFLSL